MSAIHFIDPRKHARLAGHRWWHMLQEPVFSLRRLNSRVIAPEGVWVIWSCDGRDEISQVRDLSFGGLFVETASPMAVGATATLDFLVQEGQLRADAVVRHLKPGHGVGLKFAAMTCSRHKKRRPAMKKISTVRALENEIFKEQKLTIGVDLGDRWSFYCVLGVKEESDQKSLQK